MRLVVDNPHPEPTPEPVGAPVGIASATVALLGALGSGALLATRHLGAALSDWVVLAPLAVGCALGLGVIVLWALDEREPR